MTLEISSLLRPERINLNLKSRKKADVLKELISLIKTGKEADMLLETILTREELGSTGIGKGIGIPHCRSLLIDKLELAVGRSTTGVDFNAIDKKPVHFFFLIVAPPQDPHNQYLIALGKVAMICQELAKRKQYMKPQTPEELIELIKNLETKL
ncbi:MAG: PTS sugar transporter subunit IIA [candidate division WOR-3 bacterium]|nr:PTS sugar transporter subunit IIA [candidate division WOR-3 bacterium]MCX7757783.1 PTS sugar transporter subunit IIA [candidate division WOR-3 bacterium]MDW7987497.1 PTS sugar transporter subunit IIA [candidate division WOR-3 bacterium]